MQSDTSSERTPDGESGPTNLAETWDRIKHTEWFVFAVATAFAALFPLLYIEGFGGYHSLVQTTIIWMIFALSFNLLLGQTGLLSFGHAMFWAGAAYAGAFFAINVVAEPFLMIVAGTLFAALLAALTAFVLLRLHTVYFAIVTLAFAQLLYYLARNSLSDFSILGLDLGTGGINGVRTNPEPLFFVIPLDTPLIEPLGTLWDEMIYLLFAVSFVGVVVFITRIRKSPYGLLFKAVRENETRAAFVGLNVWRYKFAAYVLSATLAGFAGSLQLLSAGNAISSRAHWQVSGDIVMTTVLGGLGTLVGPVLGSFVYYYFRRIFSGFTLEIPILSAEIGSLWLMALAITFTVVVWVYPTGLWGMITSFTAWLRDPKRPGDSAEAGSEDATGGD